MSQVTVTVGLVTSAVNAGLTKLKHQFKEFRKELSGEFANVLAVGGIIAGLEQVIAKGAQIYHLGERFGVATEALQLIGNAASFAGSNMEAVAKGMNKLVLSQQKVRHGDEELAASLKSIGVNAEEFINLSPEDAFYALADAVAKTEDRGAAYAAVVALMGKSSGELFETLSMGSEEIKKLGSSAGVMSEEAAKHLTEVEDDLTRMKSQVMSFGGEVVLFIARCVESLGAMIGGELAYINQSFSNLSNLMSNIANGQWSSAAKGAKNLVADAFMQGTSSQAASAGTAEQLDKIWHGDPNAEAKKKRPNIDLEETQSELTAKEKLAKLRETLADKLRANRVSEMDDEAKINELIKQRSDLLEKASQSKDEGKGIELQLKALELDKEITTMREKADKEAEQRADKIAKKKESIADKEFEASLIGKNDDEKLRAYAKHKAEIDKRAAAEPDEEKKLDLQSDSQEIFAKMLQLANQKQSVVTSSLAKIGGGGGAYMSKPDPLQTRLVTASEKAVKAATDSVKLLERIRDKIGEARWQP